MRTLRQVGFGVALFVLAAGSLLAQPDQAGQAGGFQLRRVMLSTGGVGYFEYETRARGDAALSFRVRRDQVDDVLKSVVVYDDEGRIGTITLPGQEPLREAFRGLPFEPEHLSSPADLFNALRGAEVRVSGAREIVGRLLSVTPETVVLPEGGSMTRHRLSLVGASGVQQVVLEDAGSISFTDPALAADVESALRAVARLEESDSRTLTVTLDGGTQERTVRVAYVVEVPLWKATYRLTLSNDPAAATAALQGWAVLENLTGEDWNGVELSVVSGNPVTFRQALYDAYYVNRPQVPVEVLGRVLPQVDAGSIANLRGLNTAQGTRTLNLVGGGAGAPAPAAGGIAADTLTATGNRVRRDDFASSFAVDTAEMARLLAADSTQAAAQVLFRVPQPVTIAAGESLLVPIVARDVPAKRLSVYQPSTHPRHPLASVRLMNDAGTGLPPGVLTLYERNAATGVVSHVGDARLAPLPAGEERLLSFAVDQEVTIDREDRAAQRVARGRIVDGVLELTHTDSQTTSYLVAAAPNVEREVVIEQPRRAGWTLIRPAEHELTESAYRFPVSVGRGETVELAAAVERPRVERFELAAMVLDRIQYWAASNELAPAIRSALTDLAALRRNVGDSERALAAAVETRNTVVADQARIRENLSAVPAESDLARRYLDALSQQEDRLAELGTEIDGLRAAVDAAQQRLADYVRTLEL